MKKTHDVVVRIEGPVQVSGDEPVHIRESRNGTTGDVILRCITESGAVLGCMDPTTAATIRRGLRTGHLRLISACSAGPHTFADGSDGWRIEIEHEWVDDQEGLSLSDAYLQTLMRQVGQACIPETDGYPYAPTKQNAVRLFGSLLRHLREASIDTPDQHIFWHYYLLDDLWLSIRNWDHTPSDVLEVAADQLKVVLYRLSASAVKADQTHVGLIYSLAADDAHQISSIAYKRAEQSTAAFAGKQA